MTVSFQQSIPNPARRLVRLALTGAATAALGAIIVLGAVQSPSAKAANETLAAEPPTSGGPVVLRRLSEAQYRNSIADIFGEDIKVPGRFDPPLREEGLLAIGDGRATISAAGIEQYELRSREIASQVLAPEKRDGVLSCRPVDRTVFDRACAATFFAKYGRLLFRRPLTSQETASFVTLSAATGTKARSFDAGLQAGLARMLNSSNFIFRIEDSVADPSSPGTRRLDDYSLAARISFLLWNAPPDAALLDAAASGALRQPGEIERQADRLIASPRFEQGVRAFFSDMFAFNHFDGLSKDQAIYPKYTSTLAAGAREQMLRTIVDLLVTNRGDYRDLFTTRKTFLNRDMGSLYKVPWPEEQAEGDHWVPYTFADGDPRAGVLTLAGFLMLDPTHEGRSSPTIRGKTVRELFLCQMVPLPPANVDFSVVQDTGSQVHKTARERLTLHQENPACAGCHALTDPIGLSLENYDAIGNFRRHENGALIDVSGKFEGKSYKNAIELQQLLHDSPTAPTCVTQRAYEYGVGRPLTTSEEAWLEYAFGRFAAKGYQFPAMMRLVATSKAFRTVSVPAAITPAAKNVIAVK